MIFAVLIALSTATVAYDPKLWISGDNAEFIVIARSLWAGDGWAYGNMPSALPATRMGPLFPLLLAPLSGQILAMKLLVLSCFVGLVAVTALAGGIPAAIIVAVHPMLVQYSSLVMSEIPYALLSILAIWLLPRHLAAAVACAVLAYFTRSIGISLLVAIVVTVEKRRRWRCVCATFAAIGIWSLRNSIVGETGSSYMQQLLAKDALAPDGEWVSIGDLAKRVLFRVEFYLGYLLAAASAVYISRSVAQRVYLCLYMGIILAWPWADTRFMLPMVPLLCIMLLEDAWRLKIPHLRAAIIAGAIFSLAWIPIPEKTHPPNWDRYKQAGTWLRKHSPPDAVVISRKPYLMHLYSGRKTVCYPFKPPGEVLAFMEDNGVTHVIVDPLRARTTTKYLKPAIRAEMDRFSALAQIGEDTFILERRQ